MDQRVVALALLLVLLLALLKPLLAALTTLLRSLPKTLPAPLPSAIWRTNRIHTRNSCHRLRAGKNLNADTIAGTGG